jgi:phage shock protein E
MSWPAVLLTAVVIVAFVVLKQMSFVSAGAAQKLLQQGALVVDVRSADEFQTGHLPGAINIPLGELRENLPYRVQDKNQALLVHCLSGGRSGIAKHQLKSIGYANVFNLGSLARARRIVGQRP